MNSATSMLDRASASPSPEAARLLRWSDTVADWLAYLAAFCMTAIAILTGVDVVLRNAVGISVHGMIDITQLAMMYTFFPCIAFAFARRAHVSVTVLTDVMPGRMARGFAIAGWFAGVIVCAYLTYAVFFQAKLIWSYGDTSQNIGIPMILYWLPIVVCLALSTVVAVAAMISESSDGNEGLHL